ncbi:hypothetical protein jhhlp_007966 [Lomentospora prolificans]|uniref:Thioredoxin-like fold domain-containing protein n=1 Tax=Lomentospora prolificans TaxID=41688 RepID=A0A2N3MZU1_9PEZI|nr:hypothetical protein jhhlp_007966 [Lomentospora prolificans]
MDPSNNEIHKAYNIQLFRGWAEPGKHVWSPFVIKLEARLRFAGVNYTVQAGSPQTAPKGKIPYIEIHGQLPSHLAGSGYDAGRDGWSIRADPNGSPIASLGDSTLIIKALRKQGLLPSLNDRLDPEQRSHDMALQALLEDKLYFYHTKERWVNNYYVMRDHALWSIPYPIRILVGLLVLRKQTAMLHGQGTGRFSDEELKTFKFEIWRSIDGLLKASKGKQYSETGASTPFWVFGGDTPTEADATLFGFIVSVLASTAGPESREIVQSLPTVVEYARRIHNRFFPDYDEWDEK